MKVKVTCTNEFLVEVDEDKFSAETNAEYEVGLFLTLKQKELSEKILRWNTHRFSTKMLTDKELTEKGWVAQWE